jgi:hypothetical protein
MNKYNKVPYRINPSEQKYSLNYAIGQVRLHITAISLIAGLRYSKKVEGIRRQLQALGIIRKMPRRTVWVEWT